MTNFIELNRLYTTQLTVLTLQLITSATCFGLVSPSSDLQRLVSIKVEWKGESGGTRRRTGGEVKGKEANGVGSQAVFSLTRNSPSSVTTIVLLRSALQESQYSTELTPPPI